MKRPYDAAFFKEMILKIKEILPNAGIGVDTLIGFPSETDKQFQNTYELIESLPVSYLHVFPFSPRKGTPAYTFDNKVDTTIIKERCAMMRLLDKSKRKTFFNGNINIQSEGLVQHKINSKTGLFKAVTSNYLTVLISSDQDLRGKIIDLIPEQCDSSLNVRGKILKKF